jgi:acetylornithine deacetylase
MKEQRSATSKILVNLDVERLLQLEIASIRIPSSTFQEGALADFLAEYMSDIGLEVKMMEVPHPWKRGHSSRQPVARLSGTGGGPTLMLNGHMDPGVEMTGWTVDPHGGHFENGWIWGMGSAR